MDDQWTAHLVEKLFATRVRSCCYCGYCPSILSSKKGFPKCVFSHEILNVLSFLMSVQKIVFEFLFALVRFHAVTCGAEAWRLKCTDGFTYRPCDVSPSVMRFHVSLMRRGLLPETIVHIFHRDVRETVMILCIAQAGQSSSRSRSCGSLSQSIIFVDNLDSF